MATYKPTLKRIRTYYVFHSIFMSIAGAIGWVIGHWFERSQIDLINLGILFLGCFLMVFILDHFISGSSEDTTSIVLTETSITARSIGWHSIEKVTFKFDEISKIIASKHRWLNPNKIVAKNKEAIFIHPAISNQDYEKIIAYLREKGI